MRIIFGYFLEAKYKFAPQFFGAVRWNQQLYDTVPDGPGRGDSWGRDAWRIDTADRLPIHAAYPAEAQYDLEHDDNGRHGFGHFLGTQLTVRF